MGLVVALSEVFAILLVARLPIMFEVFPTCSPLSRLFVLRFPSMGVVTPEPLTRFPYFSLSHTWFMLSVLLAASLLHNLRRFSHRLMRHELGI